MRNQSLQPAPISLAYMFSNLTYAVDRAEKAAIAIPRVPRKPPTDLTQLRSDVLAWVKQSKPATRHALAKKFEVTPTKMSRVLSEAKRIKLMVNLHNRGRNSDWAVS